MQRLPDDVTIEEIGQLIQSLNSIDMDELVDTHLDDKTRAELKARLV
ncbi:MAG: hypothetical protein ABIW84_02335 [Ilumatobacteraceae bacterium]